MMPTGVLSKPKEKGLIDPPNVSQIRAIQQSTPPIPRRVEFAYLNSCMGAILGTRSAWNTWAPPREVQVGTAQFYELWEESRVSDRPTPPHRF